MISEGLALALYIFGTLQGVYIGWVIWRKPTLKYRTDDERSS